MKFTMKSLFHKEQNVKETIKQWLMDIDREQSMPEEIVALNFGLFESYGIELTGAKWYDADDDDWACGEDYVPKHRTCPTLSIPTSKGWEEVQDSMAVLIKELILELPELSLWRVEHITMGFSDGDLIKIK